MVKLMKAVEDEMRAIAAEKDRDRQRKRAEEFRQKYEPQFNRLIQAAGINVAQERQRLISELGLNPAKVKPSDSLTLEIEGDQPNGNATVEVPPDARLLHHARSANAGSIPQDQRIGITPPLTRPLTWGDGESYYNEFRGEVDAFTRHAIVADESVAGSMLSARFDVGNGITHLRVTNGVSEFNYAGTWATFGYASAESFTGFMLPATVSSCFIGASAWGVAYLPYSALDRFRRQPTRP